MADLEILRSRLEAALAASGMNMKSASMQAGLGETFVRDVLRRGRDPNIGNLRKLAEVLEVDVGWLLSEEAAAEPLPHERTRGQPVTGIIENLVVPNRLMPVFAGAQGGNGKLIISSDPIDRVKLPTFLEHVAGAYGLLIDGESMVPAFEPGDVAWINPNLRPQRGRNVILYHTPPNGQDAEAIIKRLNGWNDQEWDLEQWNPHLQFKEYRKEWPICHRVVGKYDAS